MFWFRTSWGVISASFRAWHHITGTWWDYGQDIALSIRAWIEEHQLLRKDEPGKSIERSSCRHNPNLKSVNQENCAWQWDLIHFQRRDQETVDFHSDVFSLLTPKHSFPLKNKKPDVMDSSSQAHWLSTYCIPDTVLHVRMLHGSEQNAHLHLKVYILKRKTTKTSKWI